MNNFTRAGGPDFDTTPGPQKWDASTASITFQVDETKPASFRQPYPLKSPNYPSGSNASAPVIYPTLNDLELNGTDAASKSTQAIGFLIGKTWATNRMLHLDPGAVFDRGVRYELQYSKSGTWVTYDVIQTDPSGGQSRVSFWTSNAHHFQSWFRMDPRTNRLGIFITNNFRGWPFDNNMAWTWNNGETGAPGADSGHMIHKFAADTKLPGWDFTQDDNGNLAYDAIRPGLFQANVRGSGGCYTDADGVVRPGMTADASGVTGRPLAGVAGASTAPKSAIAISRPRILNRPFRSISELGYVFRDMPWRQLDFSHAASSDGQLLDVFCLHSDPITHEAPQVSRGRVNLNSAPPEVLNALFEATSKTVDGGEVLSIPASPSAPGNIGQKLSDWVTSTDPLKGPLRNRSDLVGRTENGVSKGFMSKIDTILTASSSDKSIGERRESVIRALADSSDVRTWNLMIDVVAQSGVLQRDAATLDKFIVRGQVRRWIFLSIDRFTGEILHRSSELVAQ